MADKKTQKSQMPFHVGDAIWGNIFKNENSQKQTTIALLKKVPLFKKMSTSQLSDLEKIIHRRNYTADENIFFEGDPGVGMYIIQEGSVIINKTQDNGKKEKLAELKKGEFFGELALLDESPRSAAAQAIEDTSILGLFRPDLIELIARKPRLGNKLLFELAHLIGERLKHTNKELEEVWAKLDDQKIIT